MPSILTNSAAEGANASINIHSRNAASSVAKLSSGSRIVRPGDDAASLAISNKLKSNIAALTQAKVNAGQTSSLLQIASGGASRVSEILTRLKTLSTQAVNGTLSDAERLISQEEFSELVKEIDNTVNQTQLNGIKLLSGNANATASGASNATATATNLNNTSLSIGTTSAAAAGSTFYGYSTEKRTGGTAVGISTATAAIETTLSLDGTADSTLTINGTALTISSTTTLDQLVTAINASSPLDTAGIKARTFTLSNGNSGLELISKFNVPITATFADADAGDAANLVAALGLNTTAATASSKTVSNFSGYVTGVVSDARVSQNGASTSEFKIEVDITNNGATETFSGTLTAGAVDKSNILLTSATNNLNSFVLQTHDGTPTTVSTANITSLQNQLRNLFAVGSATAPAASFQSSSNLVALNEFRSDNIVTSQAVSSDFAALTATSSVSAADTLDINNASGSTLATVTFADTDGSGTIQVSEVIDQINAVSNTTGVAATFKNGDTDTSGEIVFYSLTPGTSFQLADDGTGTPIADLFGSGTSVNGTLASSLGSVSNVISGTTSVNEGTYTLTSLYDSSTDDTTFKIQDEKGNVYEKIIKDVSALNDAAPTTKTHQVDFSNGITLTFTEDKLKNTVANATQFGTGANQFRFEIEKSGNVSVTTQIGLDAYKDLITVALDSVSTEALGIKDANGANLISIDTAAKAQAAQVVIDDAINTLNKNTAKIGALQSRFSQIDTNLTTVIENSNAANGQFVDVDFAAESSNFYKNQALLQAAVGVAAQANQMPQQLLRLVG